VNYYGQLTNERILEFKIEFGNIILDNTHAFFQKPINNIDTIYSCRKFFGVSDGAYLSTDIELKEELEIDVSKDRMMHILGRFESSASDYYNLFINADESLNREQLRYMSKLTHNILGAIDYENVRQIRNENLAFLDEQLGKKNKMNFIMPDGAFAYPFYVENGIELRKRLAKKKIYIPTLWPNVLETAIERSVEYQYVANILPLPCDQRYGIQDMELIVNNIAINL